MIGIELGDGSGPTRLREVTLADPGDPGPEEVRVRLHASSLNFHDYHVVNASTAPGRIPMSDGAGVVEAVGADVSELREGDAVVSLFFPGWTEGAAMPVGMATVPGDGVDGYARGVVVAPATSFTSAPTGYSHTQAATVTTAGVTAWRALVVDAQVKRDDVVLVLGTGGVSIFALQIAAGLGAKVVVTSSSDEKLKRAQELGAAHTINYRDVPGWGEAVLDWTGGRGVDCVVETAGAGTLEQSMAAVAPGGTVSLIGAMTGVTVPFDIMPLLFKQVRLQGLTVGSRQHQEGCVQTLEHLSIRPVIDRTFPLGGLADAFRYHESGQHFGKICVEW